MFTAVDGVKVTMQAHMAANKARDNERARYFKRAAFAFANAVQHRVDEVADWVAEAASHAVAYNTVAAAAGAM